MPYRRCLVLLTLLAATLSAAEPGKRPTVGLALSGGSAYGLAHIGVLRWLEEQRIPVDYVAGTSMGSLVGALYATGRSGREIEQFVAAIDWERALAPAVSYPDLSFRRKEDAREFSAAIEIGLRKGIRIPPGLSAGHGVGLVLSRFTAPYAELRSFDELATPLRSVATDLVKGREVVFSAGPLFDALRASMSMPAVFAPVKSGDMVLVDGGLLNNIPVDVVRAMGADIVIAVALQKPPDRARLNSLFGVAARSITVMIEDNERRSLGQADLVLMPNLDDLDSTEYDRARTLAERGYAAAEAKARLLRPLALDEAGYTAYLAARAARRRSESVKPQIVEVEGPLAPRRRQALVESLSTKADQPIDPAQLEEALNKLTGMGRYDTASYSFIQRGDAEGLRIVPHEKDYGPPFLKPTFMLDASSSDSFRFGAGVRFIMNDLGGPASELRADLRVGQESRLGAEYYYRLRGGKWFVAPRMAYAETELPYFRGNERVSDFKTREVGGSFDLGYAFGRYQELRTGYTLAHRKFAFVLPPLAVDVSGSTSSDGSRLVGWAYPSGPGAVAGRYSDLHLDWRYDHSDNAYLMRHGIRASLLAERVVDHPGMNRDFTLGEATLSYARSLGRRYSLLAETAAGRTPAEIPLSARFWLGGVGRMDAMGRGQLLGSHYYYGGARLLRPVRDQGLALLGRIYVTTAFEMGSAWTEGSAKPRYSGSLGVMRESQLGFVYAGFGVGDQGARRVFFRLGRVF